MAAGLQLVNEYLNVLRAWESQGEEFIRERFLRVAFMTRYGHIGYEEALAVASWEARMYREAVAELIVAESSKSGLPPSMTD